MDRPMYVPGLTTTTDCLPEVAAWSPDGRMVLVGDALGTLHFLDVQRRAIVLSQTIKTDRNPMATPGSPGRRAFAGLAFVCVPACAVVPFTHPGGR
jgi:hypothetical protein